VYDPPGDLWAIAIAGIIAIPALTCVVLYGGAERASLGRRRAALLAGGAAVVLGGWFTASAVIAGNGWYHTRLGHGVPWLPVAVVGFLGTLLALGRIPVVARALAAPGRGRRAALSFNAFGITDLVVALTLGALTGYQLLNVTPSGAPISELPLALIPTAAVPPPSPCTSRLVFALLRAPRTPLPATDPLLLATSR
jgi:hypothetical protein